MSSWVIAAWLMLGGSTVLLFIGMPVALTFITVNIVGAWLYMGGRSWVDATGAQQREFGHCVLARRRSRSSC